MVYFLLSFFLCNEIQASGEWWTLPRTEDDQYIYYVGSSEGKGLFTDLQDEAFHKAMAEVIREHFGMHIQISESNVEDLDGGSYQVITKQNSGMISLLGVSRHKTYETDRNKVNRVYVQIRLSKKGLEKALSLHAKRPTQENFNQYGEPHGTKTSIQVKTNPPGALIAFTHLDERLSLQGQGDAHFYLPRGRYQMVVSSPGFMAVSKEILLQASGREEYIKLEELHSKMQINIEPEDAKIFLNGHLVDTSSFKLPIGKVHKFKFIHQDYLSQEIEVATPTPEVLSRSVILEPKMSTLNYAVEPSGVTIEIDGVEVSLYNGKIHVTPGEKEIRISKKNYFDYLEKVEVKPNRDYATKFVYLKMDVANTPPSEMGFAMRVEYNPVSYQDNRARFNLVPVALFAEWKHLSLGAGIHHTSEEVDQDSDESKAKFKKIYTDSDIYLTARIFTPKWGRFKFFGSATLGSRKESVKDTKTQEETSQFKYYSGFGGGMRIYVTPRWSVSGEYFKTTATKGEEKKKAIEDRFILGISYEF